MGDGSQRCTPCYCLNQRKRVHVLLPIQDGTEVEISPTLEGVQAPAFLQGENTIIMALRLQFLG